MKKKVLSLLLVAAILCSLVPAVFAADPVATSTITLTEMEGTANAIITTAKLTQSAAYKMQVEFPFADNTNHSGDQIKWVVSDTAIDPDNIPAFGDYGSASDPNEKAGGTALDGTQTSYVTPEFDVAANKTYYVAAAMDQTDSNSMYGSFEIDKNGLLVLPKGPVALDANGGDLPADVTSPVDVTVGTYTGTAAINAAVNVTPTKANFNFVGWTPTEADKGNTAGNTTDVLTVTETPAAGSEPKLFAMWAPKTAPEAANFQVSGTYTYTGKPQKPTVTVANGVTGMGAITVNTQETNVGTYDVAISVAEATYASGNVTLDDAWTILPAAPTFTFAGKDGAEIAEGTLLKDIVVTVNGVGDDPALTAGEGKWLDAEGNELDEDAAVEPEVTYTYSYTPDASESNYKAATGTYKLGQVAAVPHDAFMFGYANTKNFGPDDNLNRAQAVTILARLDGWTDGEKTPLTGAMFSDVKEKDADGNAIWYYDAVCYAKENGIVEGFADGTFGADKPITRAEFTKMLSRLSNGGVDPADADSSLEDAKTHWANKWIADIETNYPGSITGRQDGKFHPDDKITRAETAKVINGYLGRLQSVSAKEEDQLDADLNAFDDVIRCTWYYNNVIEATVDHDASDADYHTAD